MGILRQNAGIFLAGVITHSRASCCITRCIDYDDEGSDIIFINNLVGLPLRKLQLNHV